MTADALLCAARFKLGPAHPHPNVETKDVPKQMANDNPENFVNAFQIRSSPAHHPNRYLLSQPRRES
jgi:hypothetical protein